MSNKLDTINNSGALQNERSQYLGEVADNAIVMEFEGRTIIETDGAPSPKAIIVQWLWPDTKSIEESGIRGAKSIHLPPQIKVLGPNALVASTICEKINLENILTADAQALAALAAEVATPIKLRLDKIEEVGDGAFAEANAEIYLNENVQFVEGDSAFYMVPELHYKGNLEGAPWGAKKWIKD